VSGSICYKLKENPFKNKTKLEEDERNEKITHTPGNFAGTRRCDRLQRTDADNNADVSADVNTDVNTNRYNTGDDYSIGTFYYGEAGTDTHSTGADTEVWRHPEIHHIYGSNSYSRLAGRYRIIE
jgi:hypothetical protein